jgi:hypothetical protein
VAVVAVMAAAVAVAVTKSRTVEFRAIAHY